ncbi:DNA topoisomerase IB [Nocardioides sp. Soil796]|uniref:DNA topoisomerase IB n=1 Tax=Nocardioides sp. Soil796 TaxID=1736412 RepID=UPI00070FCD5E|nr:DNA topoisomerase IB [Nocardioides sp. Soil796]KRF10358.1 DNA topoisomerase [Nocardioides sp. Soil796]
MRLRRVSPHDPGWSRRRAGRGFVYLDEVGERLPDDDAQRIRDLAVPPAWQDVWICPVVNGHLQAVGTDAAGRRQYLYHPDWRIRRDAEKFERTTSLGRALPRMRRAVSRHLRDDEMSEARACAVAVRLLDLGYFRIGNDVYTDEYGSFGLTTLERRHVRLSGEVATFDFVGKSGVEHVVTIDDARCVAAIKALRARRGGPDELMAFKHGRRWHRLEPATINDYVRAVSGVEVTAKDFRTWHATVLAAVALAQSPEPGESKASRKRAVRAAMEEVAEYLGNTPTVARTSYVDPRVLDLYEQGEVIGTSRSASQSAVEKAVLLLLGQ